MEDILRDLVVQGPLPSDGDGLFRYSSGVDQNDLVDEAPRYCYKKIWDAAGEDDFTLGL